jgi:hypothetical protein
VRLGFTLATAVAVAVASGLGLPERAAAQGRVCNNQTLRGDYGLVASGTRAVPPIFGGGVEAFIATAVWTFNGDGTFINRGLGSALHGAVTGIEQNHDDLDGIYEVNSNCTGRMQWQPPAPVPPIVYGFVIVDNGKQIKAIVLSPQPNMVTAELNRQ